MQSHENQSFTDMKKLVLLITALLLVCSGAYAQSDVLNRLKNRAKNAAEQNIGNKVEKGVNDLLNGKLGKDKKNNQRRLSRSTARSASTIRMPSSPRFSMRTSPISRSSSPSSSTPTSSTRKSGKRRTVRTFTGGPRQGSGWRAPMRSARIGGKTFSSSGWNRRPMSKGTR